MNLRPASLLFLLALLALAPLCAAQSSTQLKTASFYDIAIGEADANVVWHLNYSTNVKNLELRLTFFLPENSTLLSVSDGLGPIDSPEVRQTGSGPEVTVTARNGKNGGPITLAIAYYLRGIVAHSYGRLRLAAPLCLSITDSSSARVTLPPGSELLASSPSAAIGSSSATYSSLGECIRLAYLRGSEFDGDGGYLHYSYGHYDVFARTVDNDLRSDVSDVDLHYQTFVQMTGLQALHPAWVVVIVPKNDLSSKGEAGSYSGGGIIYLLEEQKEGRGLPSILAHETVHGFNEPALAWNSGASFWFEEGTAEYGAHLMAQQLNLREGDFFVKGSSYYTSTYDELAEYYGSGDDRMESWNFATLDQFSYDYSQFLVRAYVDAYGTDALRQTYDCLRRIDPELGAQDADARNELVLGCMSTAAGGAGRQELLYPGKHLYISDQRAFERYAAYIGSADWKGESKPLPKSAYDLPPLPYENESKTILDSLAKSYSSLEPFTSEQARAEYQSSLALYQQALDLHEQGEYRLAFAKAGLALSYYENAVTLEAVAKDLLDFRERDAASGTYGDGTSAGGATGGAGGSGAPCLPSYILGFLVLLAAYAGARGAGRG